MIFISHIQNQCNIKKLRKRRVTDILRLTEAFGKKGLIRFCGKDWRV